MTNQTQLTLGLIDGETKEVLNIPTTRRHTPERRRAVAGEIIVRIGKHRGLKLKEVPLAYLAWAVNQEATNELFRKFQQHAKAYLGN